MIDYAGGAWLYDKTYGFKDYASEAATLLALIEARTGRRPDSLLDVACGTGKHLEALSPAVPDLAGVDLTDDFLRAAAQRVPSARLERGDMRTFELGRQFDVVTCLFSAIGYAATADGLNEAVKRMAAHARQGGLVVIEPWLTPDRFLERRVFMLTIDEPELKIARVNCGTREGNLTTFVFHYLIGSPDGVEHISERHELMMFTDSEYREAFARAGLDVSFDEAGLIGRGLYIGLKH